MMKSYNEVFCYVKRPFVFGRRTKLAGNEISRGNACVRLFCCCFVDRGCSRLSFRVENFIIINLIDLMKGVIIFYAADE